MSLKYHGVIVPEGTDLADAPKSFRDLADFGNAVASFATLTERDAWASPPDGAICVVLKSSGVPANTVQQYTVGVGWRSYDPSIIGEIRMYTGATAPSADWLLCNGQVVPVGSEYDALRALVGANVPDLRDKFILGAGPKAVAATGGAATVTLATAQIPSHGHTASAGAGDTSHGHTGSVSDAGDHSHGQYVVATNGPQPSQRADYVNDTNTGNPLPQNVWTGNAGAHGHTVTINGNSASHGHTITVNAEGGGTAHENMPPYYVLSYIVRAR